MWHHLRMKYGIAATTSVMPATTPQSQADYVRRMARTAEDAGFDSVWISDRTVYPKDLAARYPDEFGLGKADPSAQNVLEAVTTLSYIAGATTRVKVGMSVLVLPFRHPVLNAKMLTTLDVLSGGRLIAGFGTGWMPEEFATMNADFDERGRVTDEHINAFIALCQGEEYKGSITSTAGMTFFPRPLQTPHPPIWIGGNSKAAIRRAVRHGDAWHGIGQSPSEVSNTRNAIGTLCETEGRPPSKVAITLRSTLVMDREVLGETGQRKPLTGSPQQIRDDLDQYQDAGLDYLILSIDQPTEDDTAQAAFSFAKLAKL